MKTAFSKLKSYLFDKKQNKIVYRFINEQEKVALENKDISKLGGLWHNLKAGNTHRYKKGVKYMHESVEGGIEACYLIRDSANSLTTDGCEVLAEIAGEGIGAQALSAMKSPNAFGNSTCITVSDGFKADGNGNYVSKDGKVTTAPLFVPHNTAIAWSNGRAVARASEQTLMLMTLSEQKCDNGETGYLIASASVDFASGDAMQSSVIGNSRTLTELVRYMGKENAPSTLVFKPFGERSIQSLTTRAASVWTVILIAIPALSCTAVGAVVLIRRRNR